MRYPSALLTLGICAALASAQPGGIMAPDAGVPAVAPGADALTFSGAGLTLSDVRFVDSSYQTLAKLKPGDDLAKLAGDGWEAQARPPKLKSAGREPVSLRCAIPAEAAGVVLRYATAEGDFRRPTVTLNGTTQSLWVAHGQSYECLLKLDRTGGKVGFTGTPIMNLWDLRGHAPGVVFDETHCEIDTDRGHNPLTMGGYVMHVSYVAKEQRARNPSAPSYARLYGLDLTDYDGYVIKVKARDASRFSAGLLDSNNFSWGGGRGELEESEWVSLAIPFEVHANYTTAGDGVLKLSQLARVRCGVGGRPAGAPVTGEYWVAGPQFYKGDPPEGVPVAEANPPMLCAVGSVAPERRKPHYFEGVSIQAIQPQGDGVWLGTDRGIFKNSLSQPGLQLASYRMNEGLIDDDVQCLLVDGKSLWIGTTCGLSRFDGHQFHNYTAADGLLPGPVMALTSDENYLWMGMARGIARYDKSSGQIIARKGKGGWAPESTGGQGVPVQEGRGVYADSIAIDRDGTIWHAAAGLTHSREDGGQMRHFLGTTKRVLAVHPAEEGVWIISNRAIELVNRDDGEVLQAFGIGSRKGLGLGHHSAFITSTFATPDGIWLGYSDGIGWFDPAQKQCHWSPYYSVGMGSLVPQCLFADKRNVWVGTDNGLLVFPISKARAPWNVLDYSAPTDLWAAGVNVDVEQPDVCEEGCDLGAIQNVQFDDEGGSPGSPGALLLSYDFGKGATDSACLSQRFDLEVDDCLGIAFRARTDSLYKGKAREFFVDVHLEAKFGRQTRKVVLRDAIKVDTNWRGYRLVFANMKLVSGSGQAGAMDPHSIHLTGVDIRRTVADFNCPQDAGKFWFDKLEWVSQRGRRA